MDHVQLPIQLAPQSLYQPILPGWDLSLFTVNVGASTNSDVEKATIQQVGSYGKQIGHLAEALEVVIGYFGLLDKKDLSEKKQDVLRVFLGDVAKARQVKSELTGP